MEPRTYDVRRLREKITQEPYRSALARIWRGTELEGFLAHPFATPTFPRAVMQAEAKGAVNTDDQNFVEFGFARSVGTRLAFTPGVLLSVAAARGEKRPAVTDGEVDWDAVEDRRVSSYVMETATPILPPFRPNEPLPLNQRRARAQALVHAMNS